MPVIITVGEGRPDGKREAGEKLGLQDKRPGRKRPSQDKDLAQQGLGPQCLRAVLFWGVQPFTQTFPFLKLYPTPSPR